MLELFTRAGIVAWPLGLCSVLAVGIMLERAFTLGRIQRLEDRAFTVLRAAFQSGDVEAAEDPRIAPAPVARVVDAARSVGAGNSDAALSAIEVAVASQRLRLRRYLSTLATIGSTAPFIGLFGTVLGVMRAFQEMSRSALSGETMAAGISEALSATALGLLVAIPSVMAYNYFLNRVQGLLVRIQGHVAALVPMMGTEAGEQVPAEKG